MEIISAAFDPGAIIPTVYTCDGADISPPLDWNGIPEGCLSLALISDDPDAPAGTWVHWVYYDLPPEMPGLPEGVPPEELPSYGGRQGTNDFGRLGYGGPCPPSGTHRYYFKLYALDTLLGLPPGATKQQVVAVFQDHVLAEAQLMGTYTR
jgi:Raf kinase inhibitor-like YbhB/YbcL family protein